MRSQNLVAHMAIETSQSGYISSNSNSPNGSPNGSTWKCLKSHTTQVITGCECARHLGVKLYPYIVIQSSRYKNSWRYMSFQGSTLSFLAGCPKSHFLGWYRNFLIYCYLKLDNQVLSSTCPKDKLGWIWRADDGPLSVEPCVSVW